MKQEINTKHYIIIICLMLVISISGIFWAIDTLAQEETNEKTASDDDLTIKAPVVDYSKSDSLIADLNRQIDEQRSKIDKLADKVKEYKNNIKKVRSKSSTLKNQVYILNNQIAKANLDIKAKEEEIKSTELEIEKVELEIGNSESLIDSNKEQLSAFIKRLNIYDQKSYLFVLLSNNSFSDFFDQVKHLEGIEGNLQKSLNRLEETVGKLTEQKNTLDKKKEQLSELLNKLDEEKLTLGSQKGTKQYLIAQTKNSEKKFQNLIEQLRQEQISVNAQVANLERRLRAELEKRGADEQFNQFGDANLIWPTNVRHITAYFHDPNYPYRYLFEHSGLDTAAPYGTPLRAAEAGYVARVAYGTKWYGNYLMIIHNNNLATLYAHLSSINVGTDQYVSKGQIIGATGNSGFSSGPHLHFEVRYNGVPVNPLNYLP